MQLIGMLDSPYVRRVAVAMIAAGVAFEHKPISLFRHIDAFTKLSPLLKAPSLVTDEGVVLVESERHPGISGGAFARGRRYATGERCAGSACSASR